MKYVPTIVKNPSLEQVKKYINELLETGFLYHLDDDVNTFTEFSEEERQILSDNMEKILEVHDNESMWSVFPDISQHQYVHSWFSIFYRWKDTKETFFHELSADHIHEAVKMFRESLDFEHIKNLEILSVTKLR